MKCQISFLSLAIADRLGTIFTPVKSDVGGNVEKLKKARASNPAATTLQQLIRAEKAAGAHKDKNGASTALLWFKRSDDAISSCI
jgi:hypothetical protein